ncbi:hypothetical protein [Salinarimonas soli]|uniref:hypothetical protein n=1 Tax=Salinarimonas soli TaxID=1638099 RepID=UPI001661EA37|nr:hypothetical protein [Salinarimonas soli]
MIRRVPARALLVAACVAAAAPILTAVAEARPLPVTTGAAVAGDAPVTQIRSRRGARNAAVAGALALGAFGAIAAARSQPRGYAYGPDYGYAPSHRYAPAYGSGYGYEGGYAPVSPGYGYGSRGHYESPAYGYDDGYDEPPVPQRRLRFAPVYRY